MTKKHFQRIADVLDSLRPVRMSHASDDTFGLEYALWVASVHSMADMCEELADMPYAFFDRQRFLDACGLVR